MNAKEAAMLMVGDQVVWPEGANGCARTDGIVCRDDRRDCLYIAWDDGGRTYALDHDAIRYVEHTKKAMRCK